MTGYDVKAARRAALLVHGLEDAQREYLLAQLQSWQRELLQPLLEDLSRQCIPHSLGRVGSIEALPPSDPDARLQQASGSDVSGCLQSCSDQTVATILRADDWPWKADLLGNMAVDRREQVLRLMDRLPPLPQAVLRVWCQRIVVLLEARETDSPAFSSGSMPAIDRFVLPLTGMVKRGLERAMRWMS